jgi:hypothetical protein
MGMTLETKSIHELRGIAQAVGIKLDWAWNKQKLIDKIDEKTKPPPKPMPQISDEPKNGDQESLVKALAIYAGMVITFPTEDTWQMNCGRKQDSGTMHMPVHAIMECARRLYES